MKKTIYALGCFDGVHLGHAALLKACRETGQGLYSGVVTFAGHPDSLLKGKTPSLLCTRQDRNKLLTEQFHMERVVELVFDERLMHTPWQDFLQQLVEREAAAGFVCGSDFRFGSRGRGTAPLLESWCRERALPCCVVPQQTLEGIRISSTHIRQLLQQGQVETANRFLGHPFCFGGKVIAGKQLGRTIDIPTANVLYPGELVKLPYGVYATRVWADGASYRSLTNIGTRPTVQGQGVTVESHLLDFSGDLYGKTIEIHFLSFIRPEIKFSCLEELKRQVEKDKKIVEKSI